MHRYLQITARAGDDGDDGLVEEDIVEGEDTVEMCTYFYLCTYRVAINGGDDSDDEYHRQNDCEVSEIRTLWCLHDYRAKMVHL